MAEFESNYSYARIHIFYKEDRKQIDQACFLLDFHEGISLQCEPLILKVDLEIQDVKNIKEQYQNDLETYERNKAIGKNFARRPKTPDQDILRMEILEQFKADLETFREASDNARKQLEDNDAVKSIETASISLKKFRKYNLLLSILSQDEYKELMKWFAQNSNKFLDTSNLDEAIRTNRNRSNEYTELYEQSIQGKNWKVFKHTYYTL